MVSKITEGKVTWDSLCFVISLENAERERKMVNIIVIIVIRFLNIFPPQNVSTELGVNILEICYTDLNTHNMSYMQFLESGGIEIH